MPKKEMYVLELGQSFLKELSRCLKDGCITFDCYDSGFKNFYKEYKNLMTSEQLKELKSCKVDLHYLKDLLEHFKRHFNLYNKEIRRKNSIPKFYGNSKLGYYRGFEWNYGRECIPGLCEAFDRFPEIEQYRKSIYALQGEIKLIMETDHQKIEPVEREFLEALNNKLTSPYKTDGTTLINGAAMLTDKYYYNQYYKEEPFTTIFKKYETLQKPIDIKFLDIEKRYSQLSQNAINKINILINEYKPKYNQYKARKNEIYGWKELKAIKNKLDQAVEDESDRGFKNIRKSVVAAGQAMLDSDNEFVQSLGEEFKNFK